MCLCQWKHTGAKTDHFGSEGAARAPAEATAGAAAAFIALLPPLLPAFPLVAVG